MAKTIAIMWVGLLIVLCLDIMVTPYRWVWSTAGIVGVTLIFGWLFNAAEEFERQQNRQAKTRRK